MEIAGDIGLSVSRLQLIREHRAQRDIFEPARLSHPLAQDTFLAHSDLAQHRARRLAAHEMHRIDAVHRELLEAEAQHGARGLGGEPLPPLGLGDPEAQLRAAVGIVERAQLDSADQPGRSRRSIAKWIARPA